MSVSPPEVSFSLGLYNNCECDTEKDLGFFKEKKDAFTDQNTTQRLEINPPPTCQTGVGVAGWTPAAAAALSKSRTCVTRGGKTRLSVEICPAGKH